MLIRRVFSSVSLANNYINTFKPFKTGTMVWGLYRNGTLLQTWTVTEQADGYESSFDDYGQAMATIEHDFRTTITITDTFNGTGAVRYEVKLISSTGNFYTSSNYSGLTSISISEQ